MVCIDFLRMKSPEISEIFQLISDKERLRETFQEGGLWRTRKFVAIGMDLTGPPLGSERLSAHVVRCSGLEEIRQDQALIAEDWGIV